MSNIEPRDFVLTCAVAGLLALTAWHCKLATEKNELQERVTGLEEGLKSMQVIMQHGATRFSSTNYTVIESEPR